MEIAFKLRIYRHGLRIHLRNYPAVFKQLVDENKIFVAVDIVLLCVIPDVADIHNFLYLMSYMTDFLARTWSSIDI